MTRIGGVGRNVALGSGESHAPGRENHAGLAGAVAAGVCWYRGSGRWRVVLVRIGRAEKYISMKDEKVGQSRKELLRFFLKVCLLE